MGIFDKFFGALKKTKEGLATKLRVLFSKNKLGDEFYEELEEVLISSDVSVTTAVEVVERVKERAIKEKLKDGDYVISLLKDVLVDVLEDGYAPLRYAYGKGLQYEFLAPYPAPRSKRNI